MIWGQRDGSVVPLLVGEWDKRTPHDAKPRAKYMKMCYTGTAEQGRGTVCHF